MAARLAVTGISRSRQEHAQGFLRHRRGARQTGDAGTLHVTFGDGTTRDEVSRRDVDPPGVDRRADRRKFAHSPRRTGSRSRDSRTETEPITNSEHTSRLIRTRFLLALWPWPPPPPPPPARSSPVSTNEAKRGSAQSKLDRVVDLIAEAMDSDVARSISCATTTRALCDAWPAQGGGARHPTAHGRRVGRHHRRRRPHLNLAEAVQHPAFAYRPETGEERYHSFAGVPIVRLESPIGVSLSRTRSRAATRRSRSRRFRRSPWCCRR